MRIKVSDKNLGECIVDTVNDIPKCEEYLIKSLMMVQMLCIHGDKNEDRFTELIDVVKTCVNKINEMYKEETNEQADPCALF